MLPRNHRADKWKDVPDEQWYDWKWQLKNRINSVEELEEVLRLTDSECKGASAEGIFRLDITPYFASLMDPEDPTCPVRRQVIPTEEELQPFTSMMEDSLAEDKHSPVPGLVHRYPDRVLMLVTTQCASYCRYCTRSRIVGDPTETFKPDEYKLQLDYLRKTLQVRDVLLSGGDPLTLAPKVLAGLLSELRKIEHIEIIHIGTRVPVFMPMRVTDELCEVLSAHHPLWMNIHVNHPKEITPEVAEACDRLTRVLSHSPEKLILRNFEGYIAAYSEPTDYTGPDVAIPEDWIRKEPGQSGIYGLMEGERISIEPKEFSESRQREGAIQHRLNSREDKWAAHGIGSENRGHMDASVSDTAPDGMTRAQAGRQRRLRELARSKSRKV